MKVSPTYSSPSSSPAMSITLRIHSIDFSLADISSDWENEEAKKHDWEEEEKGGGGSSGSSSGGSGGGMGGVGIMELYGDVVWD
ncbi:hypothetical protein LguiA_027465 [Lonicera macranthoides]